MSSYVDLPATDESPHHDPIPPAPSSSNAAVVAEEDEGDEEAAGEDKGLDYRLLSKINKCVSSPSFGFHLVRLGKNHLSTGFGFLCVCVLFVVGLAGRTRQTSVFPSEEKRISNRWS